VRTADRPEFDVGPTGRADASKTAAVILGSVWIVETPPVLIELPADDPDRARRFWEELLGTTLEPRRPDQGQGWQAVHSGVTVGVHARGSGPGDRFALPYFAVPDLSAALEQVRSLGGEVVHPGKHWAICRDSEGTPFGLGGPAPV
jgi:predicted enzyme related to lactoylglutathione lyase